VLVLGENGTGKDWWRARCTSQQRRQAHYVRINCAPFPKRCSRANCSGHEKGAFTGAFRQKPGRVEEAEGGTDFFSMRLRGHESRPLAGQAAAISGRRHVHAVGGTQELRVNRPPLAANAIVDTSFARTPDQFRRRPVSSAQRLSRFAVRPAPNEDDVLLLAEHFLKMFGASMNKNVKGISRAARQKLLAHHWPGTSANCANVIERALILETASEMQPVSLPDFAVEARCIAPSTKSTGDNSLDELVSTFERISSRHARTNHFSLTKSAERLKLSRHALRYRMQRSTLRRHEARRHARTVGKDGRRDMKLMFLQIDDSPLPCVRQSESRADTGTDFPGCAAGGDIGGPFWVVAIRKNRESAKNISTTSLPVTSVVKTAAAGVSEIRQMLHERKRRRRRGHRAINPTLAQTGGLPPVRPDDMPPSPGMPTPS